MFNVLYYFKVPIDRQKLKGKKVQRENTCKKPGPVEYELHRQTTAHKIIVGTKVESRKH